MSSQLPSITIVISPKCVLVTSRGMKQTTHTSYVIDFSRRAVVRFFDTTHEERYEVGGLVTSTDDIKAFFPFHGFNIESLKDLLVACVSLSHVITEPLRYSISLVAGVSNLVDITNIVCCNITEQSTISIA